MFAACCCSEASSKETEVVSGGGLRPADAVETTSPMDAAALMLGLQKDDGSVVELSFRRRPLGLDFEKKAPIMIKKVQAKSHAEDVGLKVGWTVVSINGEDVTKKDFAYQYDCIRKASKALPAVAK
eukprot:gnl/TRDRNA2_/TRDRNA2_185781_c0_seq1.p1 gnl/TRDRNA2_/TRDRNA2_185781_c0~~gnl/TRDRNA2_/TRDRNA2_185781_c0_seq1.p1  ORF type:complete len:126 (-),score=31.18 gnl/TRDRNA2_/TRDRNA2_185781_c0_seq1:123-500(-)